MWSGAANAIPSGWYLCNGSNGTPDLRGRFIVGYSNTDNDYDVGDTGGAKNRTVNISGSDTVNISGSDTVNISISGTTSFESLASGANHVSTGALNRRHTHTFSGSGSDTVNISGSDTVNISGSDTFDNRPPYYALCYIMKS